MSQPSAPVPVDQVAYWSGEGGQRWLQIETCFDRAITPFATAALAAAAPDRGERVLDVGCGTGGTTVDLARRVGPAGAVVGIDVSPMLAAAARQRVAASGMQHASIIEANAETHEFVPGQFDLVFSRFGVMFFHDPVAAFVNLRRAAPAGGRMAFMCWRRLDDNPWAAVPLAAARPHLPPMPAPGPEDPGPFAFGDPDRVRRILGAAGWRDVSLGPVEGEVILAETGGVDEALRFLTRAGPTGRAMLRASEAERERATAAIREALAPKVGTDGVLRLSGSCWLVRARGEAEP
jgi:SAM-dependent methyltransferase